MEDRRKHPRTAAEIFVQYRLIGGSFVDSIKDVSEGGLFLSCEHPLPLHSTIEIVFPDGNDADPLVVEGKIQRVVWSDKKSGEESRNGMAVVFDEMQTDKKKRLQHFLKKMRTPPKNN